MMKEKTTKTGDQRSRRVSGRPRKRWMPMTADGVGQVLRRAAARDRHHEAAHPDVGGERDDEGVHPQLTTRKPLMRADEAADGERDEQRDRQRQPFRLRVRSRCRCRAMQNRMPTAMAASASTDSTERSMWPAMSVSDRPIAMMPTKVDCSMMLSEDAELEKVRDQDREDAEHDGQHEPDEIVEDELDRRALARPIPPGRWPWRCGRSWGALRALSARKALPPGTSLWSRERHRCRPK